MPKPRVKKEDLEEDKFVMALRQATGNYTDEVDVLVEKVNKGKYN